MKFTNRFEVPKYLYQWLCADSYDGHSDPYMLSATSMLKPVRVHWLTLRHGAELEEDVSDVLSARIGSAIHDSIERVKTENVIKEQRAIKKIEVNGQEFSISGKFDILEDEDGDGIWTLRDIKTTSVFSYIFGGKDKDYQIQLSIYRWLNHEKYPINSTANIDFFFTDWQSSKAKFDENYPPRKLMPGYKIELMSIPDTDKYIRDRVAEFEKYRDVPDNELPLCTKEELWASEDTFAVMKSGNQKATKVCSTEVEAQEYIRDHNITKVDIICRPGKAKHCRYCSGFPFCGQGQELMERGLIDFG
jgi:hypothetical protein